jgi:hypothetical protein
LESYTKLVEGRAGKDTTNKSVTILKYLLKAGNTEFSVFSVLVLFRSLICLDKGPGWGGLGAKRAGGRHFACILVAAAAN